VLCYTAEDQSLKAVLRKPARQAYAGWQPDRSGQVAESEKHPHLPRVSEEMIRLSVIIDAGSAPE